MSRPAHNWRPRLRSETRSTGLLPDGSYVPLADRYGRKEELSPELKALADAEWEML